MARRMRMSIRPSRPTKFDLRLLGTYVLFFGIAAASSWALYELGDNWQVVLTGLFFAVILGIFGSKIIVRPAEEITGQDIGDEALPFAALTMIFLACGWFLGWLDSPGVLPAIGVMVTNALFMFRAWKITKPAI